MTNYNENEINIPPVGLLNFSRKDQKISGYNNYKDLNLWNACYINASIQCLFRLDECVKNILKYEGGNLTKATRNLINKMKNFNKKKNFCTVFDIKTVMGENNELYNENKEGDANEFISNYLNDLIEETKNTGELNWSCSPQDEILFNKFKDKFIQRKGISFILELFYGILRTKKYCNKCKITTSLKFNVFNILEMPIYEDGNIDNDKPLDINSLLNEFFDEKKNLDETCPQCQENLFCKTSINSLPKCLIIFFRRDYSNYKRNNININLKKPINFEKYLYDKSLDTNNQFYYHLKGIIFYSYYKKYVSHYKATCLVNNSKWFSFNDNSCEELKKLSIQKDENPIILFYEK